jgi:ATP-dependent Zn protease
MKKTLIKKVAIHEAGHAVMAHHFGFEHKDINIFSDSDTDILGNSGAFSQDSGEKKLSVFYEEMVFVTLGGLTAEYIYGGKKRYPSIGGASGDLKKIRDFWHNLGEHLTDQEIIVMYLSDVIEILDSKWNAVNNLAEVLIRKKKVKANEVKSIISESLNT